MDNSRIVFLINDSVRAIMGRYEETGPEEMFKTFDGSIAKDDLAVVQSGTRHMMTTIKVTAVDVDVNFDATTPLKWVVQKIDKPAFDLILGQEAQAVAAVQKAELQRKKDELRATMFKDHENAIAGLALADHSSGLIEEPPHRQPGGADKY